MSTGRITFKARVKAFSGETASWHRVMVRGGELLVRDPVAGRYSKAHGLSDHDSARVFAEAARRATV